MVRLSSVMKRDNFAFVAPITDINMQEFIVIFLAVAENTALCRSVVSAHYVREPLLLGLYAAQCERTIGRKLILFRLKNAAVSTTQN